MSRCQKRGFYVAGFKVATGEAVAHLSDGPKRVVTTRAKPGEVNVQELPDGTLLDIPRVGLLAFDKHAVHGRAGREADLATIAASLPVQARLRWLRRIAVSRTDRDAFLFVFGAPSATNPYPGVHQNLNDSALRTMMRGCRAHWGELAAIAVLPEIRQRPRVLECSIPAIDDPQILLTLANLEGASADLAVAAISQLNALRRGDLALGVARTVVYGLASPAAVKYSRYGLHYDVSYALATFLEHEFAELVEEFKDVPSAAIVELFTVTVNHAAIAARQPLSLGFPQSTPPAGIAMSPEVLQRSAERVIDLLRRQAFDNELDADAVARRIESIQAEVATLSSVSSARATYIEHSRDEISTMTTEALIQDAIVGTGPYGASDEVLFELASRHVVYPALLRDQRYVWVKALHDTGVFSRDEIIEKHFTNELRTQALPHLPKQAQRAIASDAMEHPGVRLQAMALLGDLSVWHDVVLGMEHEPRRRYYLEHTPLDILAQLCETPVKDRAAHRDLLEIAINRGAVPPELGMAHSSAVVRRAAVARTSDQRTLAAALDDDSDDVVRAALAKCRDEASIKAVEQRLQQRAHDPDVDVSVLMTTVQRRLAQLSYYRLVEVSISRGELGVARAAISELRHRDLLFDLLSKPEITSFVAERLQQVQHAPRRRR